MARMQRSLLPAIRDLCVQIASALPEIPGRGRTILITSALDGEGKSVVAAGLATQLAGLGGGRILLVDAQSRRPMVHDLIGVEPNCGFTRRLAGEPWEACVVPAPTAITRGQLDCLSGGDSKVATALANRDLVRDFLGEAAIRYAWTIIDGGACGRGRLDALPFAVDGVVLVVDSLRTKREIVQDAIDHLGLAPGRLLGVVLNQQDFPIPDFLYRRL